MNPTNQPTTNTPNSNQPVNGMPFTDQHNGVYNTLRNQMMQYAAAGVPGMEDVVNALNKTHTKLMSSYQPTQPAQPARPATPVNPALQTPQGLAQLNGLMSQIRNRNTPTPSGAQQYR